MMKRKRRVIQKICGIFSALAGAVIIIEVIPLFIWYFILIALFLGLIIFLVI